MRRNSSTATRGDNPMTMDDRQLLKACIDGNAQAQEQLVRQFSNLIHDTLCRTSRAKNSHLSRQDLEDLHSTVFVQLFEHGCRKLRQYKGKNGCSLASWIRMITVRAMLDHLRKTRDALSRPERMLPLEVIPELAVSSPSAHNELEKDEQQKILEAAIEKLSARDKLMIRMHCIEGCSLEKMAALLKVSENNVHSVKHRAVERIRKEIAQHLQEWKN